MTTPVEHPVCMVSIVNQFPSPSETFIERKARALIASGFDVTVAAHQMGRSSGAADIAPIPTLQLPMARSPRSWTDTGRLLAAQSGRARNTATLLKDFRHQPDLLPVAVSDYDIVHFEFSGIAAKMVEALPLLRPARLSVSCRGAAEQIAPHSASGRITRLHRVFAEVDLIHCVSADMAEIVMGFGAPAEKVLINRPAVDTERWQGVGRSHEDLRGSVDHPIRVVSVARLHWKKAFDDAIRAVAEARRAGLHIRYRIAGEGPEREKLLYLRHSLGLEQEVELMGWQSQADVEKLLGWADAFLLPSLSEGISNSALEAMAAGVPLISTRCGGMEEALTDEDSGILVDIGDQTQMVDALGALSDPDRRAALAEGGQDTVQRDFDLQRQANVFASAYRNLVASRPIQAI